MGADTFRTKATGATAQQAFENAQSEARYDKGHGGYTGTIAEKHDFVLITVPESRPPIEYACELIDQGDPRIDDKWGPAGCIKLGENEWLFFGWASC